MSKLILFVEVLLKIDISCGNRLRCLLGLNWSVLFDHLLIAGRSHVSIYLSIVSRFLALKSHSGGAEHAPTLNALGFCRRAEQNDAPTLNALGCCQRAEQNDAPTLNARDFVNALSQATLQRSTRTYQHLRARPSGARASFLDSDNYQSRIQNQLVYNRNL